MGVESRGTRQLEEALRVSEERFRSIIEASPMGVHRYRLEGEDRLIFIGANPAADTILGVDNQQFLGKTIEKAFPPLAETEIPSRYREVCRSGKSWSWEQFVYQDDRISGAFEVHAFRTAPQRMAVMFRDITARKMADEALRESEARFRATFEQAAVGIAHVDLDDTYLRVNKKLAEIVGYDREELLSKSFHDITFATDLEHNTELHKKLWDGAIQHYSLEKRYVRKDGDSIWVNVTVSLARDEKGTPKYFISVVEDISRRKIAEETLSKTLEELENRVQERTQKLRAANDELEAFAYSVSHDLRAPLRAVEGFSAGMLTDIPEQLDTRAKDNLRRIHAAAKRMAAMIEGMLQLSRLTRADMTVRRVDLSLVARSVVNDLEVAEPNRQVEVEIERDLVVSGDKNLLGVVIQNLVENAWKFTSATEDARISVFRAQQRCNRGEADDDEGLTCICVQDNGVGFDMSYAEKLFTPFGRLHASDEFPGTGIGLATVQRIIFRHGGTLGAEAAVGEGATFFFSLPELPGG